MSMVVKDGSLLPPGARIYDCQVDNLTLMLASLTDYGKVAVLQLE